MSPRHPYAELAYAEALAAGDGSRALDVEPWSCAVVARPIDGVLEDAAGPYPRTPLPLDADLEAGVDFLARSGLVSAVLVADPLASPTPQRLARAFAICRPFKTHFLIDRAHGAPAMSKHHRYEARRAAGRCRIERVSLDAHLAPWTALYEGLKQRHAVSGPAAFSHTYFEALARAPGYEAFAAMAEDQVVAMSIWFEHQGVAVNHLGASSEAGYALGASYALYAAAIDHYAQAAVLDLGGAAGMGDDPDDGLARFKRGFANAEAVAHLCGAVLDGPRYAALVAGGARSGFFPAYRAPAGVAADLTVRETRPMSDAP